MGAQPCSASSSAPRWPSPFASLIRDSFTGPTGLTPAAVADRTLEAIRAGRFWILTHPGERPAVEARFTDALANFPQER